MCEEPTDIVGVEACSGAGDMARGASLAGTAAVVSNHTPSAQSQRMHIMGFLDFFKRKSKPGKPTNTDRSSPDSSTAMWS